MKSFTEAIKNPNPSLSFSVDRVVVAIVLIVAVLFFIDQRQATESLRFAVTSLAGIAPYFLLAILFAGYAKASGADKLIARAFSGRIEMAIVTASIVGAATGSPPRSKPGAARSRQTDRRPVTLRSQGTRSRC